MQLRSRLFFAILFLSIIPVFAHEFWLEPQQYLFSPGDELNIRFKVGEGFHGDNWRGKKEKINLLQLHYSDVVDNLKEDIGEQPGDSLQFSMFEEGTVMALFNNLNSFIELDGQKFTDYLLEDGLTDALEYRKEHGETDSTGREFYQRSVKTIMQVGSTLTNVCKKNTALPLDIIPVDHPYDIKDAASFRIKVLFQQQPLINHKIRVWHKMSEGVTDSAYVTDSSGMIRFTIEPHGEWMVSCVNMIRMEDNPTAQWQSYWGSCTWGYTGKVIYREKSR